MTNQALKTIPCPYSMRPNDSHKILVNVETGSVTWTCKCDLDEIEIKTALEIVMKEAGK